MIDLNYVQNNEKPAIVDKVNLAKYFTLLCNKIFTLSF